MDNHGIMHQYRNCASKWRESPTPNKQSTPRSGQKCFTNIFHTKYCVNLFSADENAVITEWV